MSANTTKTDARAEGKQEGIIKPPDAPLPETFREAADELDAILAAINGEANPQGGKTPDIGIIKPLLARFRKLEDFCKAEIIAVRALTEEGSV